MVISVGIMLDTGRPFTSAQTASTAISSQVPGRRRLTATRFMLKSLRLSVWASDQDFDWDAIPHPQPGGCMMRRQRTARAAGHTSVASTASR